MSLAAAPISPSSTMKGEMTLVELSEHIVKRHHAWLREKLPEILALLEQGVKLHGRAIPEFGRILEILIPARNELIGHLHSEEQHLFPWFARIENGTLDADEKKRAFERLTQLIREHLHEDEAFARIHQIGAGFVVSEGMPPLQREIWRLLAEFERNLEEHILLEDRVLFPRVLAIVKGR